MKYAEAIRALVKAGVPFRAGSRHYIFYPGSGGIVTVPDKRKTMSRQHEMVVRKVLEGAPGSRTSNRR